MGFEKAITIAKAIKEIQDNTYVLPAIQREFVWDAEQIEKLFDSLLRGYPIGSFLFWQIDPESLGEFQFYRFMDRYHQRDYRHNESISLVGKHNVIAVLDGQQRLTALNIGLKGWYADKLPWYRWSSDHAFPKRTLHLNLTSPPPEDSGLAYEFKMLREQERRAEDKTKFWFPVNQVFAFQELHQVLDYCHEHGLMKGDSRFPYQALIKLWETINKNETVTYFLEEEQDLDKVLNIFIRVNSGGTTLSYSDMLLSIATAQWQEKDAKQEIHRLVDTLNEISEGFGFNKDFILKASLVLADAQAIEFKVNSFNKQNMLEIEKQWEAIVQTLRLTGRLLASWGYNWQTLVSNNAVIPLAYYLYKRGTPANFVESSHHQKDRTLMRQWLMLVLLRRTFSGTPDNVLRTMRRVIQESSNSFPLAEIKAAMAGTVKSLAFDEAGLEGLLGYQYNQNHTFTVLAMLYPWLKYDQHFHKDHIFPRSKITEKELRSRNIPEDQWHRWLADVNTLANLQLLQGIPNQEKSDKEPEAWLDDTFPSAAEKAAYRQNHLMPDMQLTFENFPMFIQKREEMILERLAKLLGVTRTSSEEPA